MLPLRLLAASLLASAFILPAAAQAPAASVVPWTITSTLITVDPQSSSASPAPSKPQAFTTNLPPQTFSATLPKSSQPSALKFQIPDHTTSLTLQARAQTPSEQTQLAELTLSKVRDSLLAQTNQPCAKLRSYNFTSRDLKSSHPHPSSETECTPASSAHLKTIPATVDTK
jgi:hypothetical protein